MTGRRLTGYVILQDPETLLPVAIGPQDDVPAWAAERITTPGLWEGEDAAPAAESPSPAQATAEPEVVEPPRSGPGSSRKAWEAYARESGVDVEGFGSRDEIIAALDDLRG